MRVLVRSGQTWEEVYRRELRFVSRQLLRSPANESAWNYARGLVGLPGCSSHLADDGELADLCLQVAPQRQIDRQIDVRGGQGAATAWRVTGRCRTFFLQTDRWTEGRAVGLRPPPGRQAGRQTDRQKDGLRAPPGR
jgi:hypothetical protein